MRIWFERNLFFWVGLFVLSSMMAYSFIPPANATVEPFDYLDHIFVLEYLRAQHFKFFTFNQSIPEVLGGLPIDALGMNDFAFNQMAFALFNPFLALTISETLSRIIAYICFYFLAINILLHMNHTKVISSVSALLFSLNPNIPSLTASVSFQAMYFLAVCFALKQKRNKTSVLLIFIACQNINFVYGGFVNVLILSFLIARRALLRKPISNLVLLLATVMLSFIISNYRLIHLMFSGTFISHRLDWKSSGGVVNLDNIQLFLTKLMQTIFYGEHYFNPPTSISAFIPSFGEKTLWYNGFGPITAIILIASATVIFKKRLLFSQGTSGAYSPEIKTAKAILITMFLAYVIYSAEETGFSNLMYIPETPIQIARAIVILPIAFCLLLAISLNVITPRKNHLSALIVFVAFCSVLFQSTYQYFPLQGAVRNSIDFSPYPSAKSYFLEREYDQINYLVSNLHQEPNFVSYGVDPMIASFNGLNSIDGYAYNYDLRYKRSFETIIKDQLSEKSSYSDSFENWGSRLYLKYEGINPRVNWCAANELGANFVISRSRLKTENLQLIEEIGKLFLYQIKKCL